MSNGNGNNDGGVTVKLREKAEKILISKYDRAVRESKKKYDAEKEKISQQVIKDLKISDLTTRLFTLKDEMEGLEIQIKDRLGYVGGYVSHDDWQRGRFSGKKFEQEIKKRLPPEFNIEREQERLGVLKDQLLEELWLCGQSKEVKQVLAKMG